MPDIHRILNGVLRCLAALDAPIVHALQPGLTPEEVAQVFESRGLVPSLELVRLYEWRNGASIDGKNHFYPWDFFPPLGDAAVGYDALKSVGKELACSGFGELWDDTWWPVFEDGCGDYYYSVCGAGSTCGAGSVSAPILYGNSEDPPTVEHNSLRTMLRMILACYEEGAFFVTDGMLDCNDSLCVQIELRFDSGQE